MALERKLRDIFGNNFELFKAVVTEDYIKWGFDTAEDAWTVNPLIYFEATGNYNRP